MAAIPSTGDDTITGTLGDDTISALAGDDTVFGDDGNDRLNGNSGDDSLFGDDGDDTLNGGSGDDFLFGGEGFNFIRPGNGEDVVVVGLGDDDIFLSDRTLGEGFLTIGAHSGATGALFLIDGDADFGGFSISTGPSVTGGFIENLNNALQLDPQKAEGGLSIVGTDFEDIFLVDAGDNGFLQVRPGAGADIIQIEGTTGEVRLDYSDQGDPIESEGIFANLRFGIIIDDSSDFEYDRITGSGHVGELRATDYDDEIFGSNHDERYILQAGNDYLNARGGVDLLRYDRSGVDAVDVDLAKNIATGTWGGDAFSHEIYKVENVRGSRNDDDTIKGTSADNLLDGRGGNDNLVGRSGDDTLKGDTGRDTLFGGAGDDHKIGGGGGDQFVYRDGNNADTIEDFGNGNDKINLKGVASIGSYADILATMSEITEDSRTHTELDFGNGDSITLLDVEMTDLSSADFIFNVV